MTMVGAGGVILMIAFAAVGTLWVLPAVRAHRGTFIVTCPETGDPSGVEVDARRVAYSAWGGAPDVRLEDCSSWPERADCEQGCLAKIECDGEAVVDARWRRGQECSLCGDQIPGALADVFATPRPICWDCHVVSRVARERLAPSPRMEARQNFG